MFRKHVFGEFAKLFPCHFFAKAVGGLAASQARRGEGHPVGSAHWVPLLHRARTARVALRQKRLMVVGQLGSPAEEDDQHHLN